ncbi:hypothetical protein GJAV_G00106780 [Gymnothorax javanicus]|nr:hypothetical protein GJAV_G00106780 [Gymnothorax javanicus]
MLQSRMEMRWAVLGSVMVWGILGAVVILTLGLEVEGEGGGTYVAAVYEHHLIRNLQPKVPISRQEALEHMKKNLDVYEEQAAAAAKLGAQIIVFPEDGIHSFNFSRESIVGYLEMVPDPTVVTWNPCSDPSRFPNTEVQHRLSCMAKNNSLYLVANLPGREDCDPQSPPCPADGRYQFNTDVAFSSDGTLVARYRKRHLYFEFEFDTPAETQLITFDTPFAGRFGMFTCFDILFYRPAVELVEKLGVRQLVFPTAWMNAPPVLDSVQFHRSFSYASGTTVLSANIRLDALRMTGSGIYTPWEELHHHARAGEPEAGKLLVKTIPVLDPLRPDLRPHPLPPPFSGERDSRNCLRGGAECKETVLERWGHQEFDTAGSSFIRNLFFTMVLVEHRHGNLSVCDNALCCHLQFQKLTASQELYALAAFDGLHVMHDPIYMQVCALFRCSGLTPETCGMPVEQADTLLDFRLMGNFSTRYVFPSVLSNQLQLDQIDRSGWEGRGVYMSRQGMERGLVAAVLYGRVYDRDHAQNTTTTRGPHNDHIHTSP